MNMATPPALPAPKGTGPAGRKLWQSVTSQYELSGHEEALLVELTRIADRLEALNAAIAKDGELVGNRPHPALQEARLQQVVFGRLMAVLRVPDEESGHRPQRRSMRGFHTVTGA
jgi:hypothetical protein